MRRGHHPGLQWGQQFVLAVDQVAAVVVGHLVVGGHGQRAGRAGLDAQSAADATQIIDLIDLPVALAGGVALIGGVVGSLDVDGVGRAGPRAQLAADALLQAVGVAVELVASVVARRGRPGLLRVLLGDRLLEDRLQRDAETGDGVEELKHQRPPLPLWLPVWLL